MKEHDLKEILKIGSIAELKAFVDKFGVKAVQNYRTYNNGNAISALLNENFINKDEENTEDKIKYLIEKCGLDVNATDCYGYTPCDLAYIKNKDHLLILLKNLHGIQVKTASDPKIPSLEQNCGCLDTVRTVLISFMPLFEKLTKMTNNSKFNHAKHFCKPDADDYRTQNNDSSEDDSVVRVRSSKFHTI